MTISVRASKFSASIAVFSGALLLLTACDAPPEPGPVPSNSATGTVSPSPDFVPSAADLIPPDCVDAYTPEVFALLEQSIPPLNDPGVTFGPLDNAEAQDIQFDAGVQLRCNWGMPSEVGIVTEFSALNESQTSAVIDALLLEGYTQSTLDGGVMLTRSEEFSSPISSSSVSHQASYFRDGVWFASLQLNIEIPGYNEGIVSAIWP